MAGIGSTPSLLLGFAVGEAASAAFEPALEIPKQQAWESARNRVLDPATLAALYAQGGVDLGTAHGLAAKSGYSDANLDALAYLAQTVPGVAEALHLWRLGFITDSLFIHALVKAGLDQRYIGPIIQTKTEELLGLGDIAISVVRGILPAPSYVPVPVPAKGVKVPRYPQVPIDPEVLAAKIGFSAEALQVMVGRSGLSLAPVMAAQALFRGLIAEDDFLIAIGEGDLRTEWATTVRDASRQIPTSDQFIEAWLRGWIDQPTAEAGAALHGMSAPDADLIYKTKGRPVTFHEITTGLARGGTYPSAYTDIPDPYRKSIQEADIRPEWADLHYANRYTYPSAFVLRTLAQAGELGDQAAVEQVLLEIGWPPKFATQVSTAWTQTAGPSTDPHVKKAETTLFTEAHKAYVKTGLTQQQVMPALNALTVPATAQAEVFKLWDAEKLLASETPPA